MKTTTTLNISEPPGTTFDFSTTPGERLDLTSNSPDITVNMHVVGRLTLTAESVSHNVFNSDGDTIRFIGDSTFGASSRAVLDNNLTGSGTITLTGAEGEGSSMEVNGRVGHGLTFETHGFAPVDTLVIDQPHQFHATIDISSGGLDYVEFAGLQVDHADLRGDLLSMFDDRKLVDTVRLNGGDSNLQLLNTTAGVRLYDSASPIPGAIPVHIEQPFHCV